MSGPVENGVTGLGATVRRSQWRSAVGAVLQDPELWPVLAALIHGLEEHELVAPYLVRLKPLRVRFKQFEVAMKIRGVADELLEGQSPELALRDFLAYLDNEATPPEQVAPDLDLDEGAIVPVMVAGAVEDPHSGAGQLREAPAEGAVGYGFHTHSNCSPLGLDAHREARLAAGCTGPSTGGEAPLLPEHRP